MSLPPLLQPPTLSAYTPLPTHLEATPATFSDPSAPEVLHLRCPGASLRVEREELGRWEGLSGLVVWGMEGGGGQRGAEGEGEVQVGGVDVWVGSRNLVLFSPAAGRGVKIAYPTITIHAQEGDAVLLGLSLDDGDADEEDGVGFVQVRILPVSTEGGVGAAEEPAGGAAATGGGAEGHANGHTTGGAETSASRALFAAISACQELNPDVGAEGDSDGEFGGGGEGFDPTAPGATGWITSENMHEFMGEDGGFRVPEGVTVFGAEEDGQEGLGEGAGRRRGVEDEGEDEEGAKWQRTG